MPDRRYVSTIDHVMDIDGDMIEVGVDYDSVVVAGWRFTGDSLDAFSKAFITACWTAGYNKARMEEEASDA